MVHGQGKGWSWLSVKLLHHLGLNWVFPWIVQWRFGRDLSWVAYSHLNIRFITEVYTNRERKLYINAKYFLFTCVFCFAYKFICLKACSCSMITVSNCRHPQIPLSTAISSFFPLNISQTQYFLWSILDTLLNINSFYPFSPNWYPPVQERGALQLNPNLTRTTTSIPEGQFFAVPGDLGSKYISDNLPPDPPVLRPGVWIRNNWHQRFSVKSGFPVLVVRI